MSLETHRKVKAVLFTFIGVLAMVEAEHVQQEQANSPNLEDKQVDTVTAVPVVNKPVDNLADKLVDRVYNRMVKDLDNTTLGKGGLMMQAKVNSPLVHAPNPFSSPAVMANRVSLPKVSAPSQRSLMAMRQRSKPVARAYELSGQNNPWGQFYTTPFPLDYDPDKIDYDNLPGPSSPPGAVLGKDLKLELRDYRIPYGTVWPNSDVDPKARPDGTPNWNPRIRKGYNLGATNRYGFHYHAEKTNYRLGMVAWVAVLLIEFITQQPILVLLFGEGGTRLPPGSYK